MADSSRDATPASHLSSCGIVIDGPTCTECGRQGTTRDAIVVCDFVVALSRTRVLVHLSSGGGAFASDMSSTSEGEEVEEDYQQRYVHRLLSLLNQLNSDP